MSITPKSPALSQQGRVQTWVTSRWKNPSIPGQFSAEINNQTGWTTIRGGCQYQDMQVLGFYYGRKLRKKQLASFSQYITDTCVVGEHIRECDNIVYDNGLVTFVASNIDVDEISDVSFTGNTTLTQVPQAETAENSVGNVFTNGAGSTIRVDVAGLKATSLKRSGTGKFIFTGADVMNWAVSSSLAANATTYVGPAGSNTADTNGFVVSRDGLLTKLVVQCDTAPGAGQSFTYTVMINGVASALAATISGAATYAAVDTDDGVSISADQLVCIRIQSSTSAAVGGHRGNVVMV